MSDYGIQFADWFDCPPETMVGETVFDGEGNAIGWIVNATAGAGTCHMKLLENMHTSAYQDVYECNECGEQVLRETYMGESEPPKFCPECGRKVIESKED